MATVYQTTYPIKLRDDNHTYDEHVSLMEDVDINDDIYLTLWADTKEKRGQPRVSVSLQLSYDVAYDLGKALMETAESLIDEAAYQASGRVEYIATFHGTTYAQAVDAEEIGGTGHLIDDGNADDLKAKYPEMPVWLGDDDGTSPEEYRIT